MVDCHDAMPRACRHEFRIPAQTGQGAERASRVATRSLWFALSLAAIGCAPRSARHAPLLEWPRPAAPHGPARTVTGVDSAVQLAAGTDLTCARLVAGTVACWGPTNTAILLNEGEPAVQAAVGGDALCVRTATRKLKCIRNRNLPDTSEALALALGRRHTCILRRDRRVACTRNVEPWTRDRWVIVEGLTDIAEVGVWGDHTCARSLDGAVHCWRGGAPADKSSVRRIERLDDALELAVGAEHACARRRADVVCWGSNLHGQLGDPSLAASPRPVTIPGLTRVVELAAGGAHTCARLEPGGLACWGDGRSGQLGEAWRPGSPPRSVHTDFVEVVAGERHTCARLRNGHVTCWGANGDERVLGTGSAPSPANVPPVPGLRDIVQLAVGWHHVCARDASGQVACWGQNSAGELGDGSTVARDEPVQVRDLTDTIDIAAEYNTTCALHRDGRIECWGDVGLRASTFDRSAVPRLILTEPAALDIELGRDHGCVLSRAGLVQCWGSNADLALGARSSVSRDSPVSVTGLVDATQISASGHRTCALRRDGEVVCWGRRNDDVMGERGEYPEPMTGLAGVAEVRAGSGFVCARHHGGTISCLSYRLPLDAPVLGTPVQIAGIQDAVELDVGEHVCVREASGAVLCWGPNRHGELGDGTTITRQSPTPVLAVTDAVEVALHHHTTCVRRSSGEVVCWGQRLPRGGGGGVSGASGVARHALDMRPVARVVDENVILRLGKTP